MDDKKKEAVGFVGTRRFILEEEFKTGRRLWFFDATGAELVDVVNAVEDYNRYGNTQKRGGDGTAKVYDAAEFLRVYGFTIEEETLYIQNSVDYEEGTLAVSVDESPALVADQLEKSWKARLS